MSRKVKVKIFKIILSILVIAIFIGVILYMLPVMKNLSTKEGQLAFKDRVQDSGFVGMLSLFGLQVANIFLIIVPGEPIEIIAGMCYGAFWGTIFVMASACIITIGIFFLVRKLGRKFVYDFCSKERIEKIENSKLFKNPKKIEMIMLILFLIPGTPKDLLVYLGGLLPIKASRFILISTLARIPSIISSTIAGDQLAVGQWQLGLILYAAIIVLVLIIIFIYNKFDKDKTTDEILKTIK